MLFTLSGLNLVARIATGAARGAESHTVLALGAMEDREIEQWVFTMSSSVPG